MRPAAGSEAHAPWALGQAGGSGSGGSSIAPRESAAQGARTSSPQHSACTPTSEPSLPPSHSRTQNRRACAASLCNPTRWVKATCCGLGGPRALGAGLCGRFRERMKFHLSIAPREPAVPGARTSSPQHSAFTPTSEPSLSPSRSRNRRSSCLRCIPLQSHALGESDLLRARRPARLGRWAVRAVQGAEEVPLSIAPRNPAAQGARTSSPQHSACMPISEDAQTSVLRHQAGTHVIHLISSAQV